MTEFWEYRPAFQICRISGSWAGFQNASITTTELVRLYTNKFATAERISVTTIDTLSPKHAVFASHKGVQQC